MSIALCFRSKSSIASSSNFDIGIRVFSNGLRKFRDRVAEINWEVIDEKKRDIKTEDLCQEILEANENSEYLNYEMGFRAGLLFAHDLFNL